MKTKTIILIFSILLLFVAIITNPAQEAHKEKVKTVLTTFMQKEMDSKYQTTGSGFEVLGNMLGNSIVNAMIDNMVSSDNYVLFSLTNVTNKGLTKTIGFGAFGNVWLSNDIEKTLENKEE